MTESVKHAIGVILWVALVAAIVTAIDDQAIPRMVDIITTAIDRLVNPGANT